LSSLFLSQFALQRYVLFLGLADSFLTIDGTALLNDDFLLVVILAELCRGTSFMFAEQAVEIRERIEA
jgi:hypothetical protein